MEQVIHQAMNVRIQKVPVVLFLLWSTKLCSFMYKLGTLKLLLKY